MARKKKSSPAARSYKPTIKIYRESYGLSPGAGKFFGGKFKSIEEQEKEERAKKLRERLSRTPFGGKIGSREGKQPKASAKQKWKQPKVSVKQGVNTIKGLFGYN